MLRGTGCGAAHDQWMFSLDNRAEDEAFLRQAGCLAVEPSALAAAGVTARTDAPAYAADLRALSSRLGLEAVFSPAAAPSAGRRP